jgi:hypothetical protein
LQNTFQDSFDIYASLLNKNYIIFYLVDYDSITLFLQVDTCETYYSTISLIDLFGFIPCFPLPEIQVIIIIFILVIISLILFLTKPILFILFLNIFFLVISINFIILSYKLRYY